MRIPSCGVRLPEGRWPPGRPRTAPLLDIRRLHVRYGEQVAVHGLALQLWPGETLALVGESGSGKSTTALAVLRLLAPQARVEGQLHFCGRDLLRLTPAELSALRGREIAMVFQEPMNSLNPLQTIGQQVAEAIALHERLPAQALRERALALLEQVQIPDAARRYDDHPHQLSGGQRQRVMIAMAVACRPKLLIADEPTTALDVSLQADILDLLDSLRRELGMALLLVTHDLGVVARWAERVAVLQGGRLREIGPVARLLQRPSHPYTQGLLAASLHAGAVPHCRQSRLAEIRQDEQGRFRVEWPAARPASAQPASPPLSPVVLEVRQLSVVYAGRDRAVTAVDSVGFSLRAGETLGLLGESGSGKSSLSRALLRLEPASQGQVLLHGQDLLTLSPAELRATRRRVQMVFQDPHGSLNPHHRVEDILGHALRLGGGIDAAERSRRIDRILSDVGLPLAARRRHAHEFSGGQRQRIGIARALVLRPELVICDEPVSALDVSVQAQILNLLVDLKAEYGLSYLFISHDLAVVRHMADQVLVMQQGRVVDQGPADTFWHGERHPYTRRLMAAVPSPAETRWAAQA
ncbi:MAG: ABC transporter ATP-binding protein [Curvibacter sp.]|nr:ABC transporter ATP-binding protein [Curvibacter sp.]